MTVDPHQVQITSIYYEDSRELIAALKTHRAEAAKWAIGVNLALAALGAALAGTAKPKQPLIPAVAVVVSFLGMLLYLHCNDRLTRVTLVTCPPISDYASEP